MFNQFLKSLIRYWLIILFIISFTLCFCLNNLQFTTLQAIAQTPNASQLVKQGIANYKSGEFLDAIQPWKTALELYQKSNDFPNVAIINENLARVYQQLGEYEQVLSYWQKVIAHYRSIKDFTKVGRTLTEIAQAYISLGQTGKAIGILCSTVDAENQEELGCQKASALQIALQQKDKQGEIAALGSLGEAYRLQGNYDIAIKRFEEAKNSHLYSSAIFNSLGNTLVSRAQLWNLRAKSAQKQGIIKASEFKRKATEDYQQALGYFLASFEEANQQKNKSDEMRSLLNLIQLYYSARGINLFDLAKVDVYIQKALEIIDQLPNSVNKVYAAIAIANLPALNVEYTSPLTECSAKLKQPEQIKKLFNKAIKVSQTLRNSRSESYALGALGHFYECHQEYQKALELTKKALWMADQNLQAKDSLYLWEWQAGRILLKDRNKNPEALAFYKQAYNNLEKLRSDILIADRDLQFDFRDIIEPFYRQLAQLQLELAVLDTTNLQERNQVLNSALTTINSLRLAEIQNYFGNDCILTAVNNTTVDDILEKDTAFISSIILKDKTGILLTLPNQEKYLKWINQNQEVFRDKIDKFRQSIIAGQETFTYDTTQAETLYELIISPFEKYLNAQQIKILVFIQDSFLRNVPMAALYDKKQNKYLIQKYAIATTPSLQLTSTKKLKIQSSPALILAVSQSAKVDDKLFDSLTSVPLEIETIQKQFSDSKKLVDLDFTAKNLEKEVKNRVYPIIHIATHAQFETVPEDTFLVTGDNNKLTINQLENLLRQAGNGSNLVELLALTACETAVGDDRATLGLAGVALQAGTRSAMASLWSVGDESTADLVTEFYSRLRNSDMTKAQALQAAQLKLINAKNIAEINDQYDHPYYWAPFIIIGNWF
ncbi:MAG: CHAT domain-containing protein [Desmonostoc vinosum HA7617-LM4]|jgi:CHAT domain-containing protein|nr:CHAT domain-containing protein [Desmonostoc vinosum HA7617-LM4]